MNASHRLRFDIYTLDIVAEILWRDSERIKLAPKLFGLLRHFVCASQALITKEDLYDAVWGHRFLTESALKARIAELRKILGDNARLPRYIETVPRRGYRFLATVTRLDAPIFGPETQALDTSAAPMPTATANRQDKGMVIAPASHASTQYQAWTWRYRVSLLPLKVGSVAPPSLTFFVCVANSCAKVEPLLIR